MSPPPQKTLARPKKNYVKRLENNQQIPFIGNAEGRDVLSGQFDVIVCDGFVGNVLLKFAFMSFMSKLCTQSLLFKTGK